VDETEKFLIVGLGNPGAKYKNTRHNVGFQILQSLADKKGVSFKHSSQLVGEMAQATFRDKKVFLLQPSTYMNLSGEAVRRSVDYYKIPLDHLIVVCDDVALPLGTMRMRTKGSSGGHNGLESIEAHLNTEFYARLRIGVGGPGNQVLSDYVLGRFSEEEAKAIGEIEVKAVEVLELWIAAGIAVAMQTSNRIVKNE
jgi:peptidyl-tRNA hydrolase, PTH1 family